MARQKMATFNNVVYEESMKKEIDKELEAAWVLKKYCAGHTCPDCKFREPNVYDQCSLLLRPPGDWHLITQREARKRRAQIDRL